ncbi:MAG: hypothetical protein OXC09_07630 [Truepera sp.]|nr:hypothetical protein [Truepera sp.]
MTRRTLTGTRLQLGPEEGSEGLGEPRSFMHLRSIVDMIARVES